MFEEHCDVPKTRDEKSEVNRNGGPNGIRALVGHFTFQIVGRAVRQNSAN
jgi:hypothetical protein